MEKRKHRGMGLLVLGAALLLCGALALRSAGSGMQYILPAPAATNEGGELAELYEQAQEQLAAIADSLTASAVGARVQGASIASGGNGSVVATVYAVGAGYFDVVHETLTAGRFISETDVKRAENALVLDESAALTLFAGDDPLGGKVTLEGVEYEVAGVIRGGRRPGEVDEHIAYIPITAASGSAMQMQTVEVLGLGTDNIASAILMEDTLSAWRSGGSFYNLSKLALGAVMPLRWIVLIAGAMILLSLLARLNALAWGRVCLYAGRLRTRYARDMIGGMAASALLCLLGYAALLGAAFLLARFAIEPLYVFTEWVPEVVVELSSLVSRFWSLNDANAAAARYVSRSVCVMEMGCGLVRWGTMCALLGAAVHGVPWLNRRIALPEFRRER